MLFTASLIILVIQFVLDYLNLVRGGRTFSSYQDVLSYFLFGLIGIGLLILDHLFSRHRMRRLKKRLYGEEEEE